MNNISSGNLPDEINVIIEIPMNSEGVKYEFNKKAGVIEVDRFMNVAMRYPCNYGYIPGTLGADGDPLDVLLIAQAPLLPGCLIKARVIGALEMEDESGMDEKIIVLPTVKLDPLYSNIKDISDLPEIQKKKIKHFFEHYKDLEEGKWVKVTGWLNSNQAKDLILNTKNEN
ncbi:inorganic pyrophosphatase [Candidatus Phycorickettsia trachydisci]|uniref:Inorganic pyrophosphatase n=1 Tax=Candidatus Phycorickettsia trachydisci TaxID=2115978 RepID=A0A2P1P7C6_9RICK|nr:inorganic diphosphatase [Candidatus Phycorickettsia trachydisci]AVP87169.1 inorganic pyrophosphatase [Candidatus Phycorickettsia trachydisci]